MNDVIVSIRLPEKLLSKFKEVISEEDYLDTSEGIRTIVRDNWTSFKNPQLEEIRSLREDIKKELRRKKEKIASEEVISELQRIKEMVKEDSLTK